MTVNFNQSDLRALERKIERLANIDKLQRKAILSAATEVSKMYTAALKSSIIDYPTDIVVIKKNGTRINVPRGTLRRSIGTWTPKGSKSIIAAGPRSGSFRRLSENQDGWFAHFVEYGNFSDAFGGKRSTRNTGVFARAKSATSSAMRSQMIAKMNTIIQNAARK